MLHKRLRIVNYTILLGILMRNFVFLPKPEKWNSYLTNVENIVDLLFDVVADENYCLHGGPCVPESQISTYRGQASPSAIIIGCKKGGTRALINMLSSHPKIKSLHDEGHFFDNDDSYALGDYWYRSQMPVIDGQQLVLEKTPSYMLSSLTAHRIHKFNPDIKLMAILRNPVDRLISDILQIASRHGNNHSKIEQMIVNNKTSYKLFQKGKYAVQLRPWFQLFGHQSIQIEDGNSFIKDPLSILQRLERFLNIEPYFNTNNVFFNESKGFYCWLQDGQSKCLGERKGRKHPKVDKQIMDDLKLYYKKPNEELFKLIGKKFDW